MIVEFELTTDCRVDIPDDDVPAHITTLEQREQWAWAAIRSGKYDDLVEAMPESVSIVGVG